MLTENWQDYSSAQEISAHSHIHTHSLLGKESKNNLRADFILFFSCNNIMEFWSETLILPWSLWEAAGYEVHSEHKLAWKNLDRKLRPTDRFTFVSRFKLTLWGITDLAPLRQMYNLGLRQHFLPDSLTYFSVVFSVCPIPWPWSAAFRHTNYTLTSSSPTLQVGG